MTERWGINIEGAFPGEVLEDMLAELLASAWDDALSPVAPEIEKAKARCRSLRRLRDNAAATQGERENAQAAMTRIMGKHGITEAQL